MTADDQSWYARKIAQMRGQQAPGQQAYRPMAPSPTPSLQPRSEPVQYQQPPQIPLEMLTPEQQWAVKLTEAARSAVMKGEAHRTDRDPCPRCGSNQYFSRVTTNKRMPPPAPHCYNCGYNDGMFDQGLASSWGAN